MDPLKPIEPLKKATAILHQEGPLQTGRGKVTGIIAFTLAFLCVLGDNLPEGFLKQQLLPFTWKG